MQHNYYAKTQKQQQQIQIFIGAAAFLVVLIFSLIAWATKFYLLVIVVIPIVLSIIAPFFDVPALKKSGKLKYHSLLFISEAPRNGLLKVHGGTLLDYVFVIDGQKNNKQRTRFILRQYVQGLLDLIISYETNNTEPLVVRGTSYIINERTAKRIGFRKVKGDGIQRLILILNYFNVMIQYSIAKGKLSFPRLTDTNTFEATLNELIAKKGEIERLNGMLKKSITSEKNTI
ncbi:hypothetical protein [Flagellimonas profundi]|uniref:Uncharacterized protein n=1 Tax=Flagellimonas profundi TaxID=2915620 RepID=A0ABS3FLX6_9FLAO|nr:hypothetical protein [Allomuricauda profundi]MBO0343481.1 hypothetical protein [Allomuricauda profundi]